jgi:hypothetical protein
MNVLVLQDPCLSCENILRNTGLRGTALLGVYRVLSLYQVTHQGRGMSLHDLVL